MQILDDISSNLQQGRAKNVKALVAEAVEQGIDPQTILEQGLLAGMNIIGEQFKNNEVYVPEVLVAARAMNLGSAVLKPYLAEAGVEAKGTVVIGTVKGDLHDIGKNLVKMMVEAKGITVIDLGVDVEPERFVQAAIEHNAQIICVSALLSTTMCEMKGVVDEAKKLGVRDSFKIMVGGAPITQSFCDSIGADCYTADATSAAAAALQLIA